MYRSLPLVFHGMCVYLLLCVHVLLCMFKMLTNCASSVHQSVHKPILTAHPYRPCSPQPPVPQYNYLNAALPQYDELPKRLMRSAVIGFCASFVSDCCSNSIRVVKTTKQTSKEVVSYPTAVKMVIEKDGVQGLFFRGLKTKILANGLQGLLFSVLWRMGQDYMNKHSSMGGGK